MREAVFCDILDLIYQAALDQSLWVDVLTRLALEFEAPCATINRLA